MDKIKMGNFLAELRKEKDLSQADLAEIIGVTFQAVSKWERGEAIPDITILENLASFYSIAIDDIIKGEVTVKKPCSIQQEAVSRDTETSNGFLNQKRVFGFWFALAYLILFILVGFCPFARAQIYSSYTTSVYVVTNYYKWIFSSNFDIWNFFLLIQFITTLGIIAFTMLFYACTNKKSFRSLYVTRFVFIILNLASLIMNISIISDSFLEASVGSYLIMLTILVFDILFICLKQNRKSYIIQDFQ